MEADTSVLTSVPELDRHYVKDTLRTIELLKQVQSKVSSEARKLFPSIPRSQSSSSRRALSETISPTASLSSVMRKSAALDLQAERIGRLHMELEKKVNQHILNYKKLWCRALLGQMRLVLPRELRDIVYSFIAGAAIVDIHESHMKNQPTIFPPGQSQHTPSVQCHGFRDAVKSRGFSHLLNDDFVSIDVMRELAETWYSLATHRLQSPQLIEKFLHSDVYGFNFNPCILVKKLDIVHYIRDDTSESLSQIGVGLTHLLDLDAGVKIQITVRLLHHLHMSMLRDSTPIPATKLVVLFPGIRRLLERGLQITMQFGTSLSFRVKLEELTEKDWSQKFDDFEKALQARQAYAIDRHVESIHARRSRGILSRQ